MSSLPTAARTNNRGKHAGQVVWVRVADLKAHPLNAEIYGDGPDDHFVASVKRRGVKVPLHVTRDMHIIGGHRRWKAAQIAAVAMVPVIVEDVDVGGALELLVELNQQRALSNEQIGRAAVALWGHYEAEAAARQRAGVKADLRLPGDEGSGERTRDAVGRTIGKSGVTVERARAIVLELDALSAPDGDPLMAEELRDELAQSIKGAWELLVRWERERRLPLWRVLILRPESLFTFPEPDEDGLRRAASRTPGGDEIAVRMRWYLGECNRLWHRDRPRWYHAMGVTVTTDDAAYLAATGPWPKPLPVYE